MATFSLQKISDIALFNPRETLRKNQECKKVSMECLSPFTKKITGFEQTVFSGGTKFRNGDTVVARITPCLENGKTAKISGLADGEIACGSTEFIVLRASPGKSDPDFIYYLATSPSFREVAIKSMVGSSGRQRVQQDVLENLELTLPDYSAQVRIGQILSAFDDKIELNAQINHNLEEQAKAIFKSWFVDFEPFSKTIPKTWMEGVLGDFVEIKRGGSPRPIQDFISTQGFRWLKISDATGCDSPFLIEIKEHIKESGLSKTVFLQAGALVLSNSATPGIPKILDVDSCIHDGWLHFPKSQLSKEFLFLFFQSIRPKLVLLGNGSIFTNLKTDILKTFPFFLPDKETLANFDRLILPIFEQIKNNTRESYRLSLLRDSLLPKLIVGEIDVSLVEV